MSFQLVKRPKWANRMMRIMVMKKSQKGSALICDLFFKDSAFTAGKGGEKFLTRYVKEVLFVNRRYNVTRQN